MSAAAAADDCHLTCLSIIGIGNCAWQREEDGGAVALSSLMGT